LGESGLEVVMPQEIHESLVVAAGEVEERQNLAIVVG
jgi:hypothetical protein